MTIALAKDVESFLEDQVRLGTCADASELVNDILRSVCEQQHRPFKASPALEAWLLEAAEQSATPLRKADFEELRRRVRSRATAPRA